jgi:hypothetical protein
MGKKAPKPPDPYATAAAQTGTNVATARANAVLGNVNEVTPYGGVTFDQTGTETIDGQQVPRYTKTQWETDIQKAIRGQQEGADLNLATLGRDLSGKLGTKLTDNFTVGNEPTEARLFELGRKRLDPMYAQQADDLNTRLSNQGIKLGSDAYDRAIRNFDQGKNDAYNQLLLTGRGQATQEQFAEDNQRINQISALLSGGQVTQPNFLGANMPTIPTTDIAGLINQNYANKLAAWQQKQANLGGLFAGAGQAAFALSDRRAKTNIEKVGKTDDGQKIYAFRYKDEPEDAPIHLGLMAQDVMKRRPDAVALRRDGLLAVDYDKALGLGG